MLIEKQAIARKAASFIQDNDTVLIDSGTTTLALIQEIKLKNSLTVVTNSVVHAELLKESNHIEVIVLGGRLRHETQALVGPLTDQGLNLIHVDKAFIGTNGVDLHDGLTTPNLTEAATKRKMIEQSSEVFLLADSSKFEKVSFANFGEIESLDYCITDEQVNEQYQIEFEQRGVKLEIVPLQED
nr:DeoR/GlpR family DNA-binding transcription regulator [Alkalibacillus aidingensis]